MLLIPVSYRRCGRNLQAKLYTAINSLSDNHASLKMLYYRLQKNKMFAISCVAQEMLLTIEWNWVVDIYSCTSVPSRWIRSQVASATWSRFPPSGTRTSLLFANGCFMSTLQTWTRYDAPSDELADWWQMVVGFRTFYDVVMSFLSLRFNHHFPGGPGLASTVMSPSILAVIEM